MIDCETRATLHDKAGRMVSQLEAEHPNAQFMDIIAAFGSIFFARLQRTEGIVGAANIFFWLTEQIAKASTFSFAVAEHCRALGSNREPGSPPWGSAQHRQQMRQCISGPGAGGLANNLVVDGQDRPAKSGPIDC